MFVQENVAVQDKTLISCDENPRTTDIRSLRAMFSWAFVTTCVVIVLKKYDFQNSTLFAAIITHIS